jgi:hypothetical protein
VGVEVAARIWDCQLEGLRGDGGGLGLTARGLAAAALVEGPGIVPQ